MTVIIDSSCNLPASVLKKYKVRQVPLKIFIDDENFNDPCDIRHTLELLDSGRLSRKRSVDTAPPDVEDFEKFIETAIAEGSKMVVVQTISRTQGETYNNANVAASNVLRRYGNRHDISVRVMDSRTVFAGQCLMVTETIRRMLSGQDPGEVRRNMDNLSANIHTYIVAKETLLAHERSTKRNDKSVGKAQVLFAAALGIHPVICKINDSSFVNAKPRGYERAVREMFIHARNKIREGLQSPLVAVSFVGPLEQLKTLPGYAELKEEAERHDIQLMPYVESLTAGIYVGAGAVSVALVTEPHERWLGQEE
jgi:DegV family protein with EDD domain